MRAAIFAFIALTFSLCSHSNNNTGCSGWCNYGAGAYTPLGTTFTIGTNPIMGYVTEPHGPLSQGQTMTLNYTINGNGPFNVHDNPGVPPDSPPALITLFIWEKGDNLTGEDQYAYYRWWCPTRGDLSPGAHTLSCTIDGSWTSVFGAAASTGSASDPLQPAGGFVRALNNVYGVGFTFGGAMFYGHGVTDGGTTFTINSFTVQ